MKNNDLGALVFVAIVLIAIGMAGLTCVAIAIAAAWQ